MAKKKPLPIRAAHKLKREYIIPFRIRNKPKIFGIGNNKTGTTSLKQAMEDLDYIVGNQRKAENMVHQWANRDFNELINYCRSAEFFQDVPFSKPYTFIVLDQVFPNSKFILTVRDSPEQWYNSLTKFHAKIWGGNGQIPTKSDLQKASYIYEGRAWDVNRLNYTTPENNPYEKNELIKRYVRHNINVKDYFRHRPDDLLVLNVAKPGAYKKLCQFLGKTSTQKDFPWKNKTSEKSQRK